MLPPKNGSRNQQSHAVTSAHNRTDEWRACCLDIFLGRNPKRPRFSFQEPLMDCNYDDDEDDQDSFFGMSSKDCVAVNLIKSSDYCASQDYNTVDQIDTWMTAAIAMSASIDEVSMMIQRKAAAYVSSTDTLGICFADGDRDSNSSMTNTDRSLLETTVASFAAGMAKQIESLRQTVEVGGDHPFLKSSDRTDESSHNWATGPIGHRAGIASCLMQRLKSEIMDPMTSLQIEREKPSSNLSSLEGNSGEEAFRIARNPLQGFFRGAGSSEAEFLPPAPWEGEGYHPKQLENERRQETNEFLGVYFRESSIKKCPATNNAYIEMMNESFIPPTAVTKFLDKPKTKSSVQENLRTIAHSGGMERVTQQWSQSLDQLTQHAPITEPTIQQRRFDDVISTAHEEEDIFEQLQQESATLLATYQHSDLEGVQKVERSMVEITQLLARFTDLISEQQEDIFLIHDQALKSKENVDKGQQQLVDAATRGDKSKHPMATFIVVMAMLLLFFNWITL
ncbi:hypothetical protein ACHAXS_008669 [Conticribra weissflogii]